MTPTIGTWHAQAYWVPKRGHTAAEYEDAWAVEEARGCFAIADGATESSFAAEWAGLLVRDFAASAGPEPADWLSRLPTLQKQWWAAVAERPLPWYAEEKRIQGAFATFLGLVMNPAGTWQALAIGDSCLFQLRAGALHCCFPIADAGEFGNQPWLLGSRRPMTSDWKQQAVRLHVGDWQPTDRFWLLTDALAQWLLQIRPADAAEPLPAPFDATPAGFEALVASLRDAGELRNDDCTWLILEQE